MRGTFTLGAILLALLAPQATASDLLRDESCVPTTSVCGGPGSCTQFGCVPRSCQPAFHCRSSTEMSTDCAENMSIEGETCQVALSLGVRTNAPVNEVGASVAFTNGTVLSPTDPLNLRNTWIAPSAEASASSGAVDAGDLVVGIYTTEITTTGEQEHHWSHIGVVIYHGPSVAGSQDVRAGLYLLDSMPESCYARSTLVGSFSADCPRIIPGDLLGPILP